MIMIQYEEYKKRADNEDGSALILAILMLAVLTIIGISSITTSTIEIKIAANDKVYKQSFYEADGGTEVGRELLEQNIACSLGFPNDDFYIGTAAPFVKVKKKDFYLNVDEPTGEYPSDTNWDFYYPDNDNTDNTEDFTIPHTKVLAFGNTILSTGSALQMAAGYEGKGKGSAGGGAQIIYNIYSEHQGRQNSKSRIKINYRHLIGHEGECNY